MSNERYGNGLHQLMDRLPVEGSERLERILDRMFEGYSHDLRTPFYNGESREEIIGRCREAIGYTEFEELTGIDEHEESKIGPYSIMLPSDERLNSLREYWNQRWAPDEAAFNRAFKSVCSILPQGSLRPCVFSVAYNLMPKDTSLGLPYLTSDRSFAELYFDRAISMSSPEELYPCVWFWRGQPKGLKETPKQRDVWGFDHAETILGATILYPTLDALKQRHGFSAWLGSPFVDVEATRLLKRASGRRIISMDFSGFDSSLSRALLDFVDLVLCDWFVEAVHDRIKLLGVISASVPIVVPYDVLDGRNGGMPSGSVLTNLRDTIANLLAGFYCAYRNATTLNDFLVLGDDGVYLFEDDLDPKVVSDSMSELGLESNPEKQFISTRSIHYLQRWHSLDYVRDGLCVGVHSPYRTLSGMMGYERFKNGWNKYMDTSRWIMQVENCSWDPRFPNFVKFLVDGDKILKSGVDPRTVFKRAGGSEVIRSVLDIASFPFNVKNPDRVNEFKTTELIREIQSAG